MNVFCTMWMIDLQTVVIGGICLWLSPGVTTQKSQLSSHLSWNGPEILFETQGLMRNSIFSVKWISETFTYELWLTCSVSDKLWNSYLCLVWTIYEWRSFLTWLFDRKKPLSSVGQGFQLQTFSEVSVNVR